MAPMLSGRNPLSTPQRIARARLITQGLGNEEIADRMYMSINTVKTYIRTAYRKMGVNSRARAILWGVDNGFRPDLSLIHI